MAAPTPSSQAPLRVRVLSRWEELPPLRERWNELAARAAARGQGTNIFQTYEWCDCWWRAFGAGTAWKLRAFVAERGDRVVGLAPMAISPRGLLGFVGSSNFASDYCDFLVDEDEPGALEACLGAMLETRREWRRIDLINLPSHSPHRPRIEAFLRSRGAWFTSDTQCEAPTRVMGDAASDREALNKKSLKRHHKHFADQGGLVFRHLEQPDEIRSRLEPFYQQHIDRWAVTHGESLFADPRQRRFYEELARAFLPLGMLRFSEVVFQGEALAYHFGFEYGGRYLWYKPTFNVKYLKKSPGEVLLRFLLEHVMSAGIGELDFTVGEESFKYRFANLVRTNHRLRVFRWPTGYLLFKLKQLVKRVLRRGARKAAAAPGGTAAQAGLSSPPAAG